MSEMSTFRLFIEEEGDPIPRIRSAVVSERGF